MLTIKQALDKLSESEETESLAHMISQATQQNTIQQNLAPLLPPLIDASNIRVRVHAQELTILANSTAQALKLRQMLPTITYGLQKKGYTFSDIHITSKKTT